MHLKDSGEKIVTRLSGAGLCLRKNSVYCLTCSLPNFNAAPPQGCRELLQLGLSCFSRPQC